MEKDILGEAIPLKRGQYREGLPLTIINRPFANHLTHGLDRLASIALVAVVMVPFEPRVSIEANFSGQGGHRGWALNGLVVSFHRLLG